MPSHRPVTGVIVAAFVLLTIAPAPSRADRCTAVKLRAVGKKEGGLLACYSKVAANGDPTLLVPCVEKVEDKYAFAFAAAGSCSGYQAACESLAQECASLVRADLPDAGPSRCEASRLKAAGKEAAGKMACNSKAAAQGVAVDSACIQKAETKYQTAFGKAMGCTGDQNTVGTTVNQSCVSVFGADPTGGGTVGALCLHVQP